MDSGEFQIPPVECPDCGAQVPVGSVTSSRWLCGCKTGSEAAPTKQQFTGPKSEMQSPAASAQRQVATTLSQSAIVLWATLLAVVLGAILIAPGLGIALAIVSLPAALRTAVSVHRREQKTGQSMSVAKRIALFLGWSVAVAVVAAAAGIAFAIAAFLAFLADCLNMLSNHPATTPPASSPGFGGIAAVVALVVGGLLLWAFWQIGD